jgi:ATP-binding cassette, subfamily F, member 3
LISVDNITVEFGGFTLLNEICFMINQRDRIGLVGKNGAGKSTLLKIIAGEQEADKGYIAGTKERTIGYLPQYLMLKDTSNVYEEAKKAFKEVNKLQNSINKINDELTHRTDYESESYQRLLEKLSHDTERLHMLGEGNIDEKIEQILTGLGFLPSDFTRQTAEFSGGWRMRIELTKILLQQPDILLLDEPTNHLDIEAIQWLEGFLANFNGAVILVSHDKMFLDIVTNRTVEISLGKVYDYPVPYSEYVEMRKERRAHQVASFNNQQRMIEKTEEFIERFRYKASKAVQVQSRIKQLDKIDKLEIEDEDNSAITVRFPPAPRSGTVVVECKGLSKSYGDKLILDKIDFLIERGEKVAFVGKNGEGKTTLARVLVGELDYNGTLKTGHNLSVGYFAQNQEDLLDENRTVFQTIDDIAVGDVRTKVRDILGAFLFRGDDVDKKVKVLSGGERTRLAIAKLLLKPYNLLILDEPTNHLDMRSKDVLKTALTNYDGTLIIVSHDRDFLHQLIQKTFEFKDHKAKEHIGDIFDYLQKKKLENLKELERKNIKAPKQQEKVENIEKKISYEQKKSQEKEQKKHQKQIQQLEAHIHQLEEKIAEKEKILADPAQFKTATNINELLNEYEKLKKELEKNINQWEKLIEN